MSKFCETIVSLARGANALQRIANALDFLALHVARKEGVIYNPTTSSPRTTSKDESELLHTFDHEIALLRQQEYEEFLQRGISEE